MKTKSSYICGFIITIISIIVLNISTAKSLQSLPNIDFEREYGSVQELQSKFDSIRNDPVKLDDNLNTQPGHLENQEIWLREYARNIEETLYDSRSFAEKEQDVQNFSNNLNSFSVQVNTFAEQGGSLFTSKTRNLTGAADELGAKQAAFSEALATLQQQDQPNVVSPPETNQSPENNVTLNNDPAEINAPPESDQISNAVQGSNAAQGSDTAQGPNGAQNSSAAQASNAAQGPVQGPNAVQGPVQGPNATQGPMQGSNAAQGSNANRGSFLDNSVASAPRSTIAPMPGSVNESAQNEGAQQPKENESNEATYTDPLLNLLKIVLILIIVLIAAAVAMPFIFELFKKIGVWLKKKPVNELREVRVNELNDEDIKEESFNEPDFDESSSYQDFIDRSSIEQICKIYEENIREEYDYKIKELTSQMTGLMNRVSGLENSSESMTEIKSEKINGQETLETEYLKDNTSAMEEQVPPDSVYQSEWDAEFESGENDSSNLQPWCYG